MATSRSTAAPERTAAPRRRGTVLEHAILDAALEQLGTVGWNGFTMEGVAAGAQTGKAAVYRRWTSKEELVADALRAALPHFDMAPDRGSVREDLLELCRVARETFSTGVGAAVSSVIHECDIAQAERFHGVVLEGVVQPLTRLLGDVVRRGIERGEVRPDADNEYVRDAIPAMLMYRTKMCGSEWGPRDIEELIDSLMMPLLRP